MPTGGLFITMEGPDGGGKSTQLALLAQRLEQWQIPVVCTREPGGTPLADAIRQLLLDPVHRAMSPVAEALLYAASRAQHVQEVIRPALAAGAVVLCDRFLDSSLAYQAAGRGLAPELIRRVNADAVGDCLPRLTFLLDIEPAQGLARAAARRGDGGLDRLEQEAGDFHRRVREGFLALAAAEPERIYWIDAAQTAPVVAELIWAKVSRQLGLEPGPDAAAAAPGGGR